MSKPNPVGTANASRGQIAALDALIAFTIFSLIFVFYSTLSTQLHSNGEIPPAQGFADAQRVAFQLSEWPGDPGDWNATSFRQVGLARTRGVIESDKLASFTAANITLVQDALGISSYGFRLRLLNGTTVLGQLGPDPEDVVSTPQFIAPYSMPVTYNNSLATLEVSLWR